MTLFSPFLCPRTIESAKYVSIAFHNIHSPLTNGVVTLLFRARTLPSLPPVFFSLPTSLLPASSRYPYVTGTSVLAITYKDGVMLAADTLGSYGSTKVGGSTPPYPPPPCDVS